MEEKLYLALPGQGTQGRARKALWLSGPPGIKPQLPVSLAR